MKTFDFIKPLHPLCSLDSTPQEIRKSRKILIEAAWVAVKMDSHLQEVYDRLSKNRGKKRAIIGIARRLVGRIRSCLMDEILYDSQLVCKQSVPPGTICATS